MTAAITPPLELVELSGHACVRFGRGCHQLHWMNCPVRGWHSEPLEDEPNLLSLAHVCDPADVDRRDRIFRSSSG